MKEKLKQINNILDNVAAWIEAWKPNETEPPMLTKQLIKDEVWKKKAELSWQIFIEYARLLYTIHGIKQRNTSFSARLDEVKKDTEGISKNTSAEMLSFLYFLLNEELKINPDEQHSLLISIFREILTFKNSSKVDGEITQDSLIKNRIYFQAINLFYTDLIYRVKTISLTALFRIDFAFAKIAQEVGATSAAIRKAGKREMDRTYKSRQALKEQNLKIVRNYLPRIHIEDGDTRYKIATKILEKVQREMKEPPSHRTIRRRLKDLNIP
jgi:hypothetical protein